MDGPSTQNVTQPAAPSELPIPAARPGLSSWRHLLLYLAIVVPPLVLGSILAHLGHSSSQSAAIEQLPAGTEAVVNWMFFGFIVFISWIMSRIEDRSVFDYGLRLSLSIAPRLIVGALWGVLSMSALIFLLWRMHYLITDGLLLHGFAALHEGLAWGFVFLGVGLAEEFLFRGYMQFILTVCLLQLVRRFAPRNRKPEATAFWIAAVLISFGFGLAHSNNPGESPLGLLCAGLAGLLFAFSLWRTGALWWAIGFHAAWDWAQSFLFGVADSGGVSAGRMLSSHPSGSAIMSGGLTGPEGSLMVLPVMLVIALIIVTTLPRHATRSTGLPWAITGDPVPSAVNSAEG